MNGTVDSLDPKPIPKTESTDLSETQATSQVAQALTPDWSGLPAELISKIGLRLNKQKVMLLRCVNKEFRGNLDDTHSIKRPLTAIRTGVKQEVGALKSDAKIPAYMYEGVKELIGHRNWVTSVIQLKDDRIVSG